MNKQLKRVSRTIFVMFIVLFASFTMIQVVEADNLRAHPNNQRTVKNSFNVERGAILVEGTAVAASEPSGDEFRFNRVYSDDALWSSATGYYSRNQGMTGIESALNQELTGTSNSQFLSRMTRIVSGQPPQGSSVELTLSRAAQEAAAEAMQGLTGAVVAMEPATGKILAFLSTPGFDPNALSSNDDSQIIENYRVLNSDPGQPLVNRTVSGDLYHPGSTFKLIDVAAAIESGKYTPESTFDNPAKFTLPGSTAIMQNASRTTCGTGDKVSLNTALIQSCNIPFAELAIDMDRTAITDMAEEFGFEQEIEIPIPVTPSVAPVPQDDAQAALTSIGQLDVRATPLQIAMVSAGIANNGTVMKPQLVESILAPNLATESEFTPEVFSEPISPETAATMKRMMAAVVSDPQGTAALAAIPGVPVAGKTGTAENGQDESGAERPFTLWFTGFAPVENPEVAVAVVVADGGGGAHNNEASSYELTTAIGKRVMEAVLGQ